MHTLRLVLLLLVLARTAQAVMVTDGLIHLWQMEEITGSVAADSIGSWDFQLQGGASLGAPGIEGSSVRLDGTNGFLLSSPQSTDFIESDFTLSLWVQWRSHLGKPGLLQFI